jgi:hypothetical protein
MSVETPFQLGNNHCLFLKEIDEDTQARSNFNGDAWYQEQEG